MNSVLSFTNYENIRLNKLIPIRFNKEAINNAKELLKKYPDDFPTLSQLIRSSLNHLCNERRLKEKNEIKRKTKRNKMFKGVNDPKNNTPNSNNFRSFI